MLWTSSYALAGTAASKKWETSTDDEGGAGTGSRGETHQATSLSSSYPGIRLFTLALVDQVLAPFCQLFFVFLHSIPVAFD